MARNPYEPKGWEKWSWPALLFRGFSELFGSGRKRWLADQAEKAEQAKRGDDGPPPQDGS